MNHYYKYLFKFAFNTILLKSAVSPYGFWCKILSSLLTMKVTDITVSLYECHYQLNMSNVVFKNSNYTTLDNISWCYKHRPSPLPKCKHAHTHTHTHTHHNIHTHAGNLGFPPLYSLFGIMFTTNTTSGLFTVKDTIAREWFSECGSLQWRSTIFFVLQLASMHVTKIPSAVEWWEKKTPGRNKD